MRVGIAAVSTKASSKASETAPSYKYAIAAQNGDQLEKGDPYARLWETPPKTASIVWDTYYEWEDKAWMGDRYKHNGIDRPYSVYEVHLGSWKKTVKNESLSYRELATELVDYLVKMNYTHVEFLPVMEHPLFSELGLPDYGLLRAVEPLRGAAGFYVPSRQTARSGGWGHSGLGTQPLP